MFGQTWYFSLIRKYVILVGTLFNDIRIIKSDSTGNENSLIKVPITYGPKDKMLARVMQDPNIDRQTATITLPMISFEIGNMIYDSDRHLNKMGVVSVKKDANSIKQQFNPVPYNFEFKVYVYVKNVEDGTKIIEQILPFFTPDWTTKVNLIPEMEELKDIVVTINNINYEDNYDEAYKKRRAIVWTLNLTLKGFLYGPIKTAGIIKFTNVNFYIPDVPDGEISSEVGDLPVVEKITIQPGLTSNGQPINYYGKANNTLGTVPYLEIEAGDDFGYITDIISDG
jgi:T4-like virus Myoviridae tail sheath stabiliser